MSKKFVTLSLLAVFLGLLSTRNPLPSMSENYTGGLHFITFKQLVAYITEFRNSAYSYDLDKVSQSGFVDAVVIDSLVNAGAQGIVFHYCVDPNGTGVPFLAYQACADSSNINIGNNDVLHLSYGELTTNNHTSTEITAELLSDTLTISGSDATISGTNARNRRSDFISLYGSGNVTVAYGYINAAEIQLLIQEKGSTHLHYYWGYDETESINKLRLCFVGFDQNGNNNRILDASTQSYHSFIDRSWP